MQVTKLQLNPMTTFAKYDKGPLHEDFLEVFVDALGRGQVLIHICGDNKTTSDEKRGVYFGAYTLTDWAETEPTHSHEQWREWSEKILGVKDWDSLMDLYYYDGDDPVKNIVTKIIRIPNFIDVRVQPYGSIEFGMFYVRARHLSWFSDHMMHLGKTEHHGLIDWYKVPKRIKDILMKKIHSSHILQEFIDNNIRQGKFFVLRKYGGAFWTGGHTTLSELVETHKSSNDPQADILIHLSNSSGISFRREMVEELGLKEDTPIKTDIYSLIPNKFNVVLLSPK